MKNEYDDDFYNLPTDEQIKIVRNEIDDVHYKTDNAIPDEKLYKESKGIIIVLTIGIVIAMIFIIKFLYYIGVNSLEMVKHYWFIVIPCALVFISWIYYLVHSYFASVRTVDPNISQEERDQSLIITEKIENTANSFKRIYTGVMFIFVIAVLIITMIFMLMYR